MTIVKMVQRTSHMWEIQSQSGHIIQGSITAHSEYEAEEYIKKYISSFDRWSYEMFPIKAKVIKR